jgi:hypothetical protein
MKRLKIILTAVCLAMFALGILSVQTVHSANTESISLISLDDQRILDASLQIAIYSEDGSYYDQGLGTAVNVSGEILIVTHNHWTFRNFLEKIQKAQIMNARNELLLELTRKEFLSMIRFSNPGTLILQAPTMFNITPAAMEDFRQVKIGDIVIAVHQKAADTSQLGLLKAEVRAINTYRGCDVYSLVAKNGEKIVQGDSGGGIWLNGQLLANSWGIFNEKGSLFQEPVQITVAARFPQSFLWVIENPPAEPLTDEEAPVMRYEKDEP